jgi:nuclear pore complex protein Nup43
MMFHPTQPDKFFTASDDGELWKWTQNSQRQVRDTMTGTANTNEVGNPWLNGERARKYVSVSTVLSGLRKPITSLDCTRQNRLVCASENEAVYMIDNIL